MSFEKFNRWEKKSSRVVRPFGATVLYFTKFILNRKPPKDSIMVYLNSEKAKLICNEN